MSRFEPTSSAGSWTRGVPGVEVASFVDPKRVPQMAGAEDVVAAVGPCPGPVRAGLALNERGYERLLATGLDEVRFAFGVTESFNQRNQGAAVEDSIAAARRIAARARGDGLRCVGHAQRRIRVPVRRRGRSRRVSSRSRSRSPRSSRMRSSSRTRSASPSPSAVRVPRRPRRRARAARWAATSTTRATPDTRTRSLRSTPGRRVLDASVGGLGGCPFAPNATGNIATEDLVYLLEREGVETGIDLDRLIDTAEWLAGLLGRRLEGQLYRAGRFPASA